MTYFFGLKEMNRKYWHDKEKKEAELRQVKKLKQSVNHDFTLIKKYFSEDEKKKLINKLLQTDKNFINYLINLLQLQQKGPFLMANLLKNSRKAPDFNQGI